MVRPAETSSKRRKSSSPKKAIIKGGKRRTEVVTVKKRVKPGTRALQEIKYLRRTSQLLIPKLPFSRLVREIVNDIFPRRDSTRMQASAMEALQEATEMYMVQFFEDSILLAYHCKRVTLMRRDMILMRRLRGRDDIINR